MNGGERERLVSFKNRIKQLELQLEEKTELLNQYEAVGNAADQKITAINGIHGEKIRSLMNSIQLLKKENAKLKDMNKEHKRSQLIDQLNQEIRDQDIVTEALKALINDESRSDGAIIKALNAGPPVIKSLTREELKVENKKLSNMILNLQSKLGNKAGGDPNESQISKASTDGILLLKEYRNNNQLNSMKSNSAEEPSRLDTNDTLIRRIEELKNENDELHLNLKAEEDIRMRYEEEITRRNQDLSELRSAKTELIALSKKYEFVQRQLGELKAAQAGRDVNSLAAELEKEEVQIINKTQTGKMQVATANLRVEVDNLNMKSDQAIREREEMQLEYSRVLVRYDELNRRFNKMQTEFMVQRDQLNSEKKQFQTKQAYYEKQIQELLTAKSKVDEEMQKRDLLIFEARLLTENLQSQVQDLSYGNKILEGRIKQIKGGVNEEQSHQLDGQDQNLKKQKEYYEMMLHNMQKKLQNVDQKYAANIDNISSDVSDLKSGYSHQMDEMDSNLSGSMYQKQQLYAGHYGLMQAQRVENVNSNVDSILDSEDRKVDSQEYRDFDSKVSITSSLLLQEDLLRAPKKTIKVSPSFNSSVSSMSQNSQVKSNMDALSSNVSQLSHQSSIKKTKK